MNEQEVRVATGVPGLDLVLEGEAIKVEGMEIVAVGTLADALAAGLVNASGTSGEG